VALLVTAHVHTYILSRVVCITRQITSRRIQCSEFIPHSLLHSHDLQSHTYCHRQYHKFFSCTHCHALGTTELVAAGLHWTRWFQDPHSVATNHTIGILHVPDSLATTALGDFLIHTVSLLITRSGLLRVHDSLATTALGGCYILTDSLCNAILL
jgi:hypothetical protein